MGQAAKTFAMYRDRHGIETMPGGWGHMCGATHYYDGLPIERQTYTSHEWPRASQAWATNGFITGHYVECAEPQRHQLSHRGGGRVWPRSDLMKLLDRDPYNTKSSPTSRLG